MFTLTPQLTDPKDLIPTLQSLAMGKAKLLVKRPHGKEVQPGDEFLLNVKFEDRRRKFHVNAIQQQETVSSLHNLWCSHLTHPHPLQPEEDKETSRHIDQDRSYAIDAAVVRIMKGSKRLKFEELKTKTVEALKAHFVPNIADIKKQIESLVMREYLERDEKDKNMYCYVA
jgi:cullin 4